MKVALLFGGRSVEHEVSIRSARSVMKTLRHSGHEVIPVGISPDGAWFTAPNPLGVAAEGEPEGTREPVLLRPEPGAPLRLGERSRTITPDIYFPLVHGSGGEDGTLQGLLELAEAPYAGSGVAASAVAMDKGLTKALARQAGLPVLDWREVTLQRWEEEPRAVLAELEAWEQGPVFVKPVNGGSSVGVSRAAQIGQRPAAIEEALRYDRRILVEPALEAREIEVSMLGNEPVEASIPGEILPSGQFYDYRAKYQDARTRLLVPAPLEPAQAEEIRRLAVRAFTAIRGAGLGRVDFLVERRSWRPFLSEINTLPGCTDVSLYPRLWEATGVPYRELLDRILSLGLEQAAARRRVKRHIQ